MIGRVVSVKMAKSAVVLVESNKKHPLYGKIFLRTKKYLADDPIGVKLGDVVEIEKVRPISKNKHFQIKKVLGSDFVSLGKEALKEKAKEAIAEVLPEEKKEESKVQSPTSAKATADKQELGEKEGQKTKVNPGRSKSKKEGDPSP